MKKTHDFAAPVLLRQQTCDGVDAEQAAQPVPLVAVPDPEADVGVAAFVAAAGVHDAAEGPADGGAERRGVGGVDGCGLRGLLGGIEAGAARGGRGDEDGSAGGWVEGVLDVGLREEGYEISVCGTGTC